jgi:hypothetical protein
MSRDAKRTALACLLGVIILTIVIAAALPQLPLTPGVPLPSQPAVSGRLPPDQISPLPAVSVNTFWKAVLGILLAAGLIYNVYRLLTGARWSWNDAVRSLLYMTVPACILVGLVLIVSNVPVTAEPSAAHIVSPSSSEVPGRTLAAAPTSLISPAWPVWPVWLGLAAALTGLGLWLVFRPPARPMPDGLQLEAERALQALNDGLDLKNVILRCYSQMAQVLKREKGLEMEAAMTPREFERLAEARGMPPVPVQQLTQLFEAARYGHQPPDPFDERQAIECLTAIVRYCQTGKQPH